MPGQVYDEGQLQNGAGSLLLKDAQGRESTEILCKL